MLRAMDLKAVLKWLLTISIILNIISYYAIVWLAFPSWPVYRIATVSSVVTPLLIALLSSNTVWRPLWRGWAQWDSSKYPDLNGTWEGTIEPVSGKSGAAAETLPIKARIRHSMFEILVDFHGETFDSFTLAATPRIDQGHHYLYYIYRSESRVPNRPVYLGTATLRVQRLENGTLALGGQYYTGRKTIGTINLKQTSRDPDKAINTHQHK
jgi:hypothetical protein